MAEAEEQAAATPRPKRDDPLSQEAINRRGAGVIASGSPFTLDHALTVAVSRNLLPGEGSEAWHFLANPEHRAILLAVHAELSLEWANAVISAMHNT